MISKATRHSPYGPATRGQIPSITTYSFPSDTQILDTLYSPLDTLYQYSVIGDQLLKPPITGHRLLIIDYLLIDHARH